MRPQPYSYLGFFRLTMHLIIHRSSLKLPIKKLHFYNDRIVYSTGYNHYGVVLTTTRGKRWLIHKGFGFSRLSHSVIVDAQHMSRRWELMRKNKVYNARVRDFFEASGTFFHPVFDNAFHAAKRMMEVGKVKRKHGKKN